MSELPFHAARFQDALRTETIGRFLTYRLRTGSTMDLARTEAADGAPHGTLVLAEEQTAGRGRKGRSFHSPAGENLYFTLVLRVSNEAQKLLPVAVPLAVCEAIQRDAPDAAIKWPNDIWLGGRKLCGMLIDAESSPEGAVAYPGIGINVNGDPTLNPELRDIATSLRRELGREVEREELLARICNALEAALETPEPALVREYRARSLVLGQNVTVIPASGGGYGALAVGIAADGSLVVEHPNGSRETVTAAEVSLRPA